MESVQEFAYPILGEPPGSRGTRALVSRLGGDTAPAVQHDVNVFRPSSRLGVTLQRIEEKIEQLHEQLRLSRRALAQERRRNRALFDCSPEPYLLTDMSGKILDGNRATAELLGIPRRALVGRPLGVFVAWPARRDFHARLFGLSALPQHQQWTFSVKTRHRGEVRVSAKIALAHGETNRELELHWILHEQLIRSPARLLQLATRVSHIAHLDRAPIDGEPRHGDPSDSADQEHPNGTDIAVTR